MERTDGQMKRESLKAAIVESLRKRKNTLIRTAQYEIKSLEYPQENTLDCQTELVLVSALLHTLESTDYNPFLAYDAKYPDDRTIYEISDEDIDIIASDVDVFILRAIRRLYIRLYSGAYNIFRANTIKSELITVFDHILASNMKEFRQ